MYPNQNNGQKSGRSIIVLILGILSVTGFGPLTGIPAWVIGNSVLADMRSGREDPSDMQLVQIGRILGIVVTGLFALGLLIFLLILLFGGFVFTSLGNGGPGSAIQVR